MTNAKQQATNVIYFQDILKVAGKVQQVLLKPDEQEWHKGLVVYENGFCTQELPSGKINIDLNNGVIGVGDKVWRLSAYTPEELFSELSDWAQANGGRERPERPEFSEATKSYNPENAKLIHQFFSNSLVQLESLKRLIHTGTVSPTLLYPHHFDLSFSWTQAYDESRLTFGFLLGDGDITEPYAYATSWPDPEVVRTFESPPLNWNEKGFKGLAVKYNEIESNRFAELLSPLIIKANKERLTG